MVVFKIVNCTINRRKGQNTTLAFSKYDYGFLKEDVVSKEWLLENVSRISSSIQVNKNTTIQQIKDSDLKEEDSLQKRRDDILTKLGID